MKEELVDIVDQNDIIISTLTRAQMREKNLLHRCTFILVKNQKGEIFITKRSKTKDIAPDLYEIGQGGVVTHGESYEESAKREIEEELGIKDAELNYIFDFHFKDSKSKYIAKVFECYYAGKIIMQKEEIQSGFFVTVEKLKEMLHKSPENFTSDSILFMNKYLEYLNKK